MKLPEAWPLYAKWFVVWLVIVSMIVSYVSAGLLGLLVIVLAVGLIVYLVDRMFSLREAPLVYVCGCSTSTIEKGQLSPCP